MSRDNRKRGLDFAQSSIPWVLVPGRVRRVDCLVMRSSLCYCDRELSQAADFNQELIFAL